jgi:transcriptional regulator with XRE-family HTH domain
MEVADRRILGHRVRAARRRAGLTLAQVGSAVGRPAPYLSRLENGYVEPRAGLITALAGALGCPAAELLDPTPPDERTALVLELERLQDEPTYGRLGLPGLRGDKLPEDALRHLVALAGALGDADRAAAGGQTALARRANVALRAEMRGRDNHFAEIEAVAGDALAAAGYPGHGPVPERVLTDLAGHLGFRVERVAGLPRSARSVTDRQDRVVYVAQSSDLQTRGARSVVLQTLGHFALEHDRPGTFEDYLRQRIESNYFAAAVLAPEAPAVGFLADAKKRGDISVEDLREVFYISYEMAAHRLTNLATHHLDIPVHFLRTDPEGTVLKAYENDGLPLPADADGGLEGQRVSRHWGARQAWYAADSYSLQYQYTRTTRGEYWSVTHVETGGAQPDAITVGTTAAEARWFRGHDTIRRVDARTERVDPDLVARWEGAAWPSAAERSHALSALPPAERPFTPFPGVDLVEVYQFLDRQRQRR